MTPEYKSSALQVELITLVYWFYWPIFSLFPRALQLEMNIIIKKQKLENPGIDPGASRMQIERSTSWANPPCALILFTNLFIISSWVAISNEYNYKEKIGEFGIDPGDSRIQIERSTTWANPLVHCFYWPIFSLFPRELQLAMNVIRKKGNWRIRVSIPVIRGFKSSALPLYLFPVISSWVAISNEYNYKEKEIGESGYRSRCFADSNRALYHFNQSPFCIESIHQYFRYILVSCN